MAQPPAFQFYASDYLSSSKVQRMTLEAEGAYIRLLAYNWQDGYIPSDIAQLSRMCKTTPKRMAVLWDCYLRDCFVPSLSDPDRLVNLRLEVVRKQQAEYRQAQSESGSKGAAVRWRDHKRKDSDPINSPMAKNGSPSPSPSPSPTPVKEKPSLRSGKTKCPEVMPITDHERAWALKNQITIDLEAETEALLDWARGKGELKADWEATRRNWWREAQKRATKGTYGHRTAAAVENPNTRAAKDFVSRELAKTLRPNLPDVREDPGGFPRAVRDVSGCTGE